MSEHKKTLRVTTSCEDCVFATWMDDSTQEGCSLGRLDKFEEMDLTELITEGKQFYQINTVCNTKRDQEWGDGVELPGWLAGFIEDDGEGKLNLLKEIIVDDVAHQYGAIVIMELLEYINETIPQLLAQTVVPKTIVVVSSFKDINYQKAYKLIQSYIDVYNSENRLKVNFHLVRLFKDETARMCIDAAVKKLDTAYYSVFFDFLEVPERHFEKLNKLINHDMRRITMISSNKMNHVLQGLTVQTRIHTMLHGNKPMYLGNDETKEYNTIEEKIAVLAEDQGVKEMMTTWDQV